MKKFIAVLISIIVAASFVTFSVNAEASVSSQENILAASDTYVEHFDDGSYLVVTFAQSPSSRASTYTKTGRKTFNLYNSDDELQWEYILVGTFEVTTGVSARCTGSTYEYKIYDDSWSLTSHENSCARNAAYGKATFKKKVLFITTSTQDIDARLTCDSNGNIK